MTAKPELLAQFNAIRRIFVNTEFRQLKRWTKYIRDFALFELQSFSFSLVKGEILWESMTQVVAPLVVWPSFN